MLEREWKMDAVVSGRKSEYLWIFMPLWEPHKTWNSCSRADDFHMPLRITDVQREANLTLLHFYLT